MEINKLILAFVVGFIFSVKEAAKNTKQVQQRERKPLPPYPPNDTLR